jgi:hypothetical protein
MESAWACLEEHRCAWRSLETSRKGFRKRVASGQVTSAGNLQDR